MVVNAKFAKATCTEAKLAKVKCVTAKTAKQINVQKSMCTNAEIAHGQVAKTQSTKHKCSKAKYDKAKNAIGARAKAKGVETKLANARLTTINVLKLTLRTLR